MSHRDRGPVPVGRERTIIITARSWLCQLYTRYTTAAVPVTQTEAGKILATKRTSDGGWIKIHVDADRQRGRRLLM